MVCWAGRQVDVMMILIIRLISSEALKVQSSCCRSDRSCIVGNAWCMEVQGVQVFARLRGGAAVLR